MNYVNWEQMWRGELDCTFGYIFIHENFLIQAPANVFTDQKVISTGESGVSCLMSAKSFKNPSLVW